jgi:hypothetical protein
MDTQKYLQIAQHYIKKQDYNRARSILQKMDHAQARKLLREIDRIAPETAPVPVQRAKSKPVKELDEFETFLLEDDDPPEKPKRKPKLDDTRYVQKPFNPGAWFVFGFFTTTLVTNIALAFNWRRLGKREWFAETLVLGIGLPVALFALLVALFVAYFRGSDAALAPLLALTALVSGLNLAFTLALVGLQSRTHRLWEQDDIQGMLTYEYPMKKAFALGAVLTLLVALGGYLNYKDMFLYGTYTDGTISLTYPPRWQLTGCEPNAAKECLMNLDKHDWTTQSSSIYIFRYDNTGFSTGAEYEEYHRSSYLSDDPAARITALQEVMLDGHPARVRQVQWGNDKCADHARRFYVVHENSMYMIHMGSTCEQLWKQDGVIMEKIVQSVQFD